jgi:hypothetical protein
MRAMNVTERAFTADERRQLEEIARAIPGRNGRFRRGAVNALVLFAASTLGLVIVWGLVAWVVNKLAGVEFGFDTAVAPWVFGIGIPLAAIGAIVSSVRWLRGWENPTDDIRQELATGTVLEEHHVFTEARRFQEPEHGGLIYFLRTADDRAFVVYDGESQDLGVGDGDPLASPFKPHANLRVVRTPRSRMVLDKTFSGPVLDAGAPLDLAADPKDWPEQDEYCAFGWGELEARL